MLPKKQLFGQKIYYIETGQNVFEGYAMEWKQGLYEARYGMETRKKRNIISFILKTIMLYA